MRITRGFQHRKIPARGDDASAAPVGLHLGRLLIRWTLAPEDPKSVIINTPIGANGEPGKPASRAPMAAFNLSHSGDWIALLTGPSDRNLGVDLETTNRDNWDAILSRYGAADDLEHLKQGGQQAAGRLWSGREAIGKAHGDGMIPVMRLPLCPEMPAQADIQITTMPGRHLLDQMA